MNNYFKIIYLVIIIVFIHNNGLAQAKKKQIERLSSQVDSLNQIISKKRESNFILINSFTESSEIVQKKIDSLNQRKKEILAENKSLENEINQLNLNKKSLLQSKLIQSEILEKLNKNKIPERKLKRVNSKTETRIGEQTWMTRNLDVGTFRNGDSIFHARTFEEWYDVCKKNIPACFISDDDGSVKYYNWYAVNDKRGLAPIGWHVPSMTEWKKLLLEVGDLPWLKLKSKNHWGNYNFDCPEGLDLYNFAITPDGAVIDSEHDVDILIWGTNASASFWTSTGKDKNNAHAIEMGNSIGYELTFDEKIEIHSADKSSGMSVRCIKD